MAPTVAIPAGFDVADGRLGYGVGGRDRGSLECRILPTDRGFVQEKVKSLRSTRTSFRTTVDGIEKYIAMFAVRVHVYVAMRRHGDEVVEDEQQQQQQ